MPKLRIKKSFFRAVHFQAAFVLITYFFVSNIILLYSTRHPSFYVSFFVPLIFGTASSFIFLYLFGHKDFFHFIGKFEKEEGGKEKKYLDKFSHFGKLFACILVNITAGPIFMALTIRFFFKQSEHRYRIAFISTLVSTVIVVGLAKGVAVFIFR